MSSQFGARHAIDADIDAAVGEVLRLTGNAGADVVIDTAGGATALKAGIDMLRPGGRFSAFSVSHTPPSGFTTFPLYYKELSLIGSRALVPEDMEPSIELVASGKVPVAGFISATYPLERTAEAFEEYERNPGRILRIVITS